MGTRSRLLIAVEAQELFHRFEAYIARDLPAGQSFHPRHCFPRQLEAVLGEHDTGAVILIQPRFHDDLPAAVRRWKTLRPDLQVLFLFRRLPGARSLVELMRAGAFDVMDTEIEALGDPLIQEVLSGLSRRLEEVRAGSFERAQARSSLADVGLIGESAEMQNVSMQILHAARLSCAVLISGEPGSGKRVAAHAIHALGPNADRQMVTIDCLSLSSPLLSLALFGQNAAAAGGALLLHEISEIPRPLQARLQKALESPETDIRLISTSSRRMDQLVEAKGFRADLCYRLSVLPIEMPPLRRRLQDVPLLAQYFLSRLEREGQALALSAEAGQALCNYHWPGNVLELKLALESAAVRTVDGEIPAAHLPEMVTGARRVPDGLEPFVSSELNLARLERQAILRALQISGFDKARTARLLGIGKTTMYRKLKEMSGKPRQ